MKNSVLLPFVALTVLISGLLSAAHVAAHEKAIGLDDGVQPLGDIKAVPTQLNYQGYLADAADSSAVTATLEMTFRLYDAAVAGSELWSETHPAVEVQGGLFQVLLGSVTPFPAGLFDGSELWLQTEVGLEILVPRKPLVSVAYSQRTANADHAMMSDEAVFATEAGFTTEAQHAVHADTAAYSPSASPWMVSGDDVYRETGKVGIGTDTPSYTLDVDGSVGASTYYGDGSNLTGISGSADDDWTIRGDTVYHATGPVGIGTASPSYPLDISGAVNATTYYGDGSHLTGISGTTDNDWTIVGDNIYHLTGNVGIGTTSLDEMLHIENSADGQRAFLQIETSHATTWQEAGLRIKTPENTWHLRMDDYSHNNLPNPGSLSLRSQNKGSELMTWQQDGHIGIGTTDPLAKLHILATDLSLPAEAFQADVLTVEAQDAVLGLYSSEAGSVGSVIALGEITGGALVDKWALLRETPTGGKGLRFTYGTNSNPWQNNAVMYLDDTGKVGIGTTTPSAALDVSGHINVNKGGVGGLALEVDGTEAVRCSSPGPGSYFTWGYGATANYFPDPIGLGTTSPGAKLHIVESGSTHPIRIEVDDTTAFIVSTSAFGQVGIGTPYPGSALDVHSPPGWLQPALSVKHYGSYGVVAGITGYTNPESGDDILSVTAPDTSPNDFQFIECTRGTFLGTNVFQVNGNGSVWSAGGYTSHADLSEMVAVSSGAHSAEPGDVMVIDPYNPRAIVKSDEPRSTGVAGIYSTRPGFIGSERHWNISTRTEDGELESYSLDDMTAQFDEIPLAVLGIVPCKVSAENGQIRPGDLLVTSDTPGHAMRDDNPRAGTIVGKAFGSLSSGTGVITVLVTLH